MNSDKLQQLRLENLLLRVKTTWDFVNTTENVDWNNGAFQYLEINSDVDIKFFNGKPGHKYVLKILIHSGYKVLSWDSSIRWPSGVAPLSGAVDEDTISYYGFIYLNNGTTQVYDNIAQAEALIAQSSNSSGSSRRSK